MSTHSIAEAKDRLVELIARARKGEDVVITENGRPVAELKSVAGLALSPPPKHITQEAIAWLEAHRVGIDLPGEDAGAFVSRMRDEEWER